MGSLFSMLLQLLVILGGLFVGYTVVQDRTAPIVSLSPQLRVVLFILTSVFTMNLLGYVEGFLSPLLVGSFTLVAILQFVIGLALAAGLVIFYRMETGVANPSARN